MNTPTLRSPNQKITHNTSNTDSAYVIDSYATKAPFASFLPGIAGVEGIPMWCFYCNRGQGICSFGIENKNKSMMEFHPANKSYERVNSHGFRTFIKIGKDLYEPFSYSSIEHSTTHMSIEKNVLTMCEYNSLHQLEVRVSYCIVPQEHFGALLRQVYINNKGAPRSIELLDGMPEFLPFGLTLETTKNMSFTARAWAGVELLEDLALYRTRSEVGDEETVDKVTNSYFFASLCEGRINPRIIYDRDLVFAHCSDLSVPVGFARRSLDDMLATTQYAENKYSSAFVAHTFDLKDEYCFDSYFGYVEDVATLKDIKNRLVSKNFSQQKLQEARTIVADIVSDIETQTGISDFDHYLSQTYLDNLLRGGYPLSYQNRATQKTRSQKTAQQAASDQTGQDVAPEQKDVYYCYGRKHGDLERDYNFFHLEALPYSQGNGNFRDMCQNRRNDVFFHPAAGRANILTFFNLIQIDGYNPLNIQGVHFSVEEHYMTELEERCAISFDQDLKQKLALFSYGELYCMLSARLDNARQVADILTHILYYARKNEHAQYIEGYWIDHFSYLVDLLDAYVEVYPDSIYTLLTESPYCYYSSPARVKSRREKYHMNQGALLQREAVALDVDKQALIVKNGHHWLTNKKGIIQTATLAEKLLCLIAHKTSCLDPFGCGIEMEAGKPGWNDALNGLPSMLGSSLGERYEVIRLIDFFLRMLSTQDNTISWNMHERVVSFADDLVHDSIDRMNSFDRWNTMSTLREQFRVDTFAYLDSATKPMSYQKLSSVLGRFRCILAQGDTCTYHTARR